MMTLCPLYKEACESKPWDSGTEAHRGLLFDKFANAWLGINSDKPEFDKGGYDKQGTGDWLKKIAGNASGNKDQLAEACDRQRHLVEKMGGKVLYLKNASRFITGMGREHPLENGFAWHHTLGVPYLPGSSVKGVLRAWDRESQGKMIQDKNGNDQWRESAQTETTFGSPDNGVGHFIVLDMLPLKPTQLVVDIMTPHYGDYYQDGETPGDWLSPVPISFLAVEASQPWQLAILPGPRHRTLNDDDLGRLRDDLFEALAWLGAGAKTAVGYGRFEKNAEVEQQIQKQQERKESERLATEQTEREQREFERSLESMSDPLKELKTKQKTQQWKPEANDNKMIDSLSQFIDQSPEPPEDCLDFIRCWLESIPNYKGVWSDPNAMKGKKKDKPKYNSKRIRDIVTKLNPPEGS